MKTTLVCLLSGFLFTQLHAQQVYKPLKKGWAKYLDKNMVTITPDTLLCGKYEVMNVEYRQFLNELKSKGDLQNYKRFEVDSTGWRMQESYNEPLVNVYHWHPAYAEHPVVNISYDAAVAFCKWLTEKYNNDPARKYKKVLVKLPSEQQWKRMYTSNGLFRLYPWKGIYTFDRHSGFKANYGIVPEGAIKRDQNGKLVFVESGNMNTLPVSMWALSSGFLLSATEKLPPNPLGCYHVAGNVSEMLEVKGVRKGGSFLSPGYYLTLDATEEFPERELGPMIGFRYFIEVLEK